MNAFSRIRQVYEGHKLIQQWIEKGGMTVPAAKSNNRAFTCLHCPKNKKGAWFDWLTRWLANRIIRTIPTGSRPEYDASKKIKTCQVCGCALRLKVRMPLLSILVNQKPEELEKFPGNCWIKKECDL